MENEDIENLNDSTPNIEPEAETVTPETAPEKPKEEPKPTEAPEARKARLERQLKRTNKELGIEETPKPKTKQKDELDYGNLAFHNSKSESVKVEHDDDIEFLKNQIEDTGKSQQDILNSTWFKSELKERQDKRAVDTATPDGGRGATETPSTKADFWLKSGGMPEGPENQKLREEIVNLRMKTSSDTKKFADQSVVG